MSMNTHESDFFYWQSVEPCLETLVGFMMQQCPSPSLQCHFWPNTLKIDHFPSPLATQLEHVSPGQRVQPWQGPAVPSVQGLSMSCLSSSVPFWLKMSELTPFTDGTDRPAGPHQSFSHPKPTLPVPLFSLLQYNHSRSPSHSAASNRTPSISNLTHFPDC